MFLLLIIAVTCFGHNSWPSSGGIASLLTYTAYLATYAGEMHVYTSLAHSSTQAVYVDKLASFLKMAQNCDRNMSEQ